MQFACSFDDVLLVPKQCPDEGSRKLLDLSTNIGGLDLALPFISSNMPSVTEGAMACEVAQVGGLGIIHRMCSIESQVDMLTKGVVSGAAVGIGSDYNERASKLVSKGASLLCIDVAHGHNKRVLHVANELLAQYNVPVIIGNIATGEAALYFLENIPSIYHSSIAFKVGVGGGSVCTTRVRTGCGLPTFQSIVNVVEVTKDYSCGVVADGGIRNSGDIVKSLAAGANSVMLGSLLAGTDEAPGSVISDKSNLYKVYRGAASHGEKKDFFGKAEYVEGVEKLIPYKGSTTSVLESLAEGVRSGLSYCGVSNLQDLYNNAHFVKVSSSGHQEGLPHGLF